MQLQLDDAHVDYLIRLATEQPDNLDLQHIAVDLRKEKVELTNPLHEKFRAAARKCYGEEGSIEIDDGAPVSMGSDPGAYVQAWVWVYNSDAGIDSEDGSEDLEDEG